MAKRENDILFLLVKTLEKAEKRHFKLFIKRSSSKTDLKIIQLFDALDKMSEYEEALILKKVPAIKKIQLANLKSHLYQQLLTSLRLVKTPGSLDLHLNEQYDFAHILYKKGLYNQSLKMLERVKALAARHQKFNFLIRVLAMEKRIESLHITRSVKNRSEILSRQAIEISGHISSVAHLSNLSVIMYDRFIKYGHARNEKEEESIRAFLQQNLARASLPANSFYEKMYLYQGMCWYAYICQDFLLYYRYAQKWVDLFNADSEMIRVETGHYIKGMHQLLNAHFDLRNDIKFAKDLKQLELFAQTKRVQQSDSFSIQCFLYIHQAKINQHFMQGSFKQGLKLVPEINKRLEQYKRVIDKHRILVLNYKIALLYFGSGGYSIAIDYLNNIINQPVELRSDLHCYARLLHLLAHFEMGNEELIAYQAKSVYRFMARMENLTVIEEEIFRFLRRSANMPVSELPAALEAFLNKIKHLETNRFQTRALAYLDVISWLESKVYKKTMEQVIQAKYKARKKRRYTQQPVAEPKY